MTGRASASLPGNSPEDQLARAISSGQFSLQRYLIKICPFEFAVPCRTSATTGHMTAPPLHRDVTGYNGEALGVFCRTSTSIQLVATIRPFARVVWNGAELGSG